LKKNLFVPLLNLVKQRPGLIPNLAWNRERFLQRLCT
jgi:hypothetical protein